jgi:hypothetical protein
MTFFDAADALDDHSLVEHQSQSTILILDSTIDLNVRHVTRFNVPEPVQNVFKSMKEYQQLHRWYSIGCKFVTSNP